ncbi:hypothetical protein [Arthrobacter burdickii]|uniref:HPt domain-containing protein n=1 Tax=Arthrobacter burdickii TaxID=3035920 RepID=A0ABT8JZ09_9MICC|nr:hypothetical protein [Arthrobacter burdickii]MDN4610339.1 hypothetical protein [Arthrobacter burdickii]
MPTHPTPPRPGQRQDGGTVPPLNDADPAANAPGKAAPLLDPAVLRDMERDFPGTSVVERFARDFAETLVGKLNRLDLRFGEGDAPRAEDAVLSVTTSAAMVGATRLTHAAIATQRLIAADDLEAAQRSVALLRACASDTIRELQEIYPGRP